MTDDETTDEFKHAMDAVRAYDGTNWDAELAFARELSESIEVDHDDGPSAIGFQWDGLTYWFLIDETGCQWDSDDPRETMVLALLDQRMSLLAEVARLTAACERDRAPIAANGRFGLE